MDGAPLTDGFDSITAPIATTTTPAVVSSSSSTATKSVETASAASVSANSVKKPDSRLPSDPDRSSAPTSSQSITSSVTVDSAIKYSVAYNGRLYKCSDLANRVGAFPYSSSSVTKNPVASNGQPFNPSDLIGRVDFRQSSSSSATAGSAEQRSTTPTVNSFNTQPSALTGLLRPRDSRTTATTSSTTSGLLNVVPTTKPSRGLPRTSLDLATRSTSIQMSSELAWPTLLRLPTRPRCSSTRVFSASAPASLFTAASAGTSK